MAAKMYVDGLIQPKDTTSYTILYVWVFFIQNWIVSYRVPDIICPHY